MVHIVSGILKVAVRKSLIFYQESFTKPGNGNNHLIGWKRWPFSRLLCVCDQCQIEGCPLNDQWLFLAEDDISPIIASMTLCQRRKCLGPLEITWKSLPLIFATHLLSSYDGLVMDGHAFSVGLRLWLCDCSFHKCCSYNIAPSIPECIYVISVTCHKKFRSVWLAYLYCARYSNGRFTLMARFFCLETGRAFI